VHHRPGRRSVTLRMSADLAISRASSVLEAAAAIVTPTDPIASDPAAAPASQLHGHSCRPIRSPHPRPRQRRHTGRSRICRLGIAATANRPGGLRHCLRRRQAAT